MRERIYIKDSIDGQQHCISGDEQFYLIDVTEQLDIQRKMVATFYRNDTIDGLLDILRRTRHNIIEMLDNALKNGLISQREREIFYFRHIDWNSLENTGKKFGVTRERIRQIEAKVLEKMRNNLSNN